MYRIIPAEEEAQMRRIGSRAVSWVVVAAVTAMLSPLSMAFASVNDDQVTSQKLKEADGTTGQDANLGSGVKTAHIQDGAVTDAKIGGTISGTKLGAHGHNGSDISDGTITGSKFATGSVIGSAIADGAVTDAKILGTISGNKLGAHGHSSDDITGIINSSNLPVGAISGTVAAGDHNHDTLYQRKYGKVAVVAVSGGDYANPAAALADSTAWCSVGPCLLKIMPGTYNTGVLQIPSNIDIEGSGINSTKLIGSLNFWYASNNEIRNFSLDAVSLDAPGAHGIQLHESGNITFSNFNLFVSTNMREIYGIISTSSAGDLRILNSSISVTTTDAYIHGIIFGTNTAKLYVINTDINVLATGYSGTTSGILTDAGTVFISGSSVVVGDGYALVAQTAESRINVSNTKLDGAIWNPTSTKCISVFNKNFDPVACQ